MGRLSCLWMAEGCGGPARDWKARNIAASAINAFNAPQSSMQSHSSHSSVTAAWGAGDTHMMTEEEMAARDQALMGEHSNPDSVAISIPEDFTKSVPSQVKLVLYPA